MIRVSFDPDPGRTHKNCPTCLLLLPIEKFWRSTTTPDGRQAECKKCQRLRKTRRYRWEPLQETA